MAPRPTFRGIAAAALAASMLSGAGAATAQNAADQLRQDTRALRQQRAVESRALTQPGAASLDAMNARNRLVRGQSGNLSPTQRRVERRLDTLSAGPSTSGLPSTPRAAPLVSDRLPSSYEDDVFQPRDLGSSVVEGLLDRVDDGLADGRPGQARSDLDLAEQQLDRMAPADAAPLRERASALRGRLTTSP